MSEARKILPDETVRYSDSLTSALADVDAVVVVTPWEDFQSVPSLVQSRVPQPVIVDCRRAFDKTCVERYEGIGL